MEPDFNLSAYDYHLPPEQIAQQPAARRDRSKLMVLDCRSGALAHKQFSQITEYLRPGDLLVVNNTRVFPARLYGRKESGGKVELLLLHYPEPCALPAEDSDTYCAAALALVRSSKRPAPGSTLFFGEHLRATVQEILADGKVRVMLRYALPEGKDLDYLLALHGHMPLPPYIRRGSDNDCADQDMERYQTRYASRTGSVAAPTAGLHFTDQLLGKIRSSGVTLASVTLHVGYGTFAPVRSENIREHRIHAEYVEVGEETARAVNLARDEGRRIWAVGTTTARTLEFAAAAGGIRPFAGPCDLYIYPGYRFRVVDNLITNFHLPRSSLLFLVSALAGRDRILDGYREAIDRGYRFYSYGDAMAIITRQ